MIRGIHFYRKLFALSSLAEDPLTLLSWIGEQIRVGKLSPLFRIRFSSDPFIKGPHIEGQIVKTDYKGNYHPSMHPTITRASLVTLEDEQLLYYTISQKSFTQFHQQNHHLQMQISRESDRNHRPR